MKTEEFIEIYKCAVITKITRTQEDKTLWILYYTDGFPHKVGNLTLRRLSSPCLWGLKKQIDNYKPMKQYKR